MDVFLIPTMRPARYALYYEAREAVVVDGDDGRGLLRGLRRGFADMLREAEHRRHRRHERAAEPGGLLARVRRRLMRFVVERIAEQRLLWHMRKATAVSARIPADLAPAEADRVVRVLLKTDADYHLKWLLIDLGLLIPSAVLTLIPGPNIIGLYFTFQVVGHYLSLRGARQGLFASVWTFQPSADLAELREAMRLAPPHRQRRFRELADRLRLEHLATFCEDVAAPTA